MNASPVAKKPVRSRMKPVRVQEFFIPRYGSVVFAPVTDMPGFSHRVCWKNLGGHAMKPLSWLGRGEKISARTARFFARVACARADGHPDRHYADLNVDPPERLAEA